MVQGYTQQNSGSKGGWTSYLDSRRAEGGKPFSGTIIYRNEVLLCSYTCGVAHDQWTASLSQKNLSYQELKQLIEKLEGLC